jgi:hypothetical protein
MMTTLHQRVVLITIVLFFGAMVWVPARHDVPRDGRGHRLLSEWAPMLVLRLGRTEDHAGGQSLPPSIFQRGAAGAGRLVPAAAGIAVAAKALRSVETFPSHWASRHLTI